MGQKCNGDGIACGSKSCENCGWNPKEERIRKALIRSGMLERDKNGLERLVLKN